MPRGSGMAPTRRRKHTQPEKAVPDVLRTFRPSTDPQDYRDHRAAIAALVGDHRVIPVMASLGLAAADWYRMSLSLSSGNPGLRVVK
jgi:hypothetical protein